MVKSILKRIIVGVGVALALMFIKGNLLLNVNAEAITMQPSYIITGNFTSQSGSTVYQSGWGGLNVYAFPDTQAIDWDGSASVYFVYNSFSSGYCTGTQNNGSVSGTIFNGSRSLSSSSIIYIEDRSNSTNHKCDYSISGARVDFTCYDVNLSHQQNIFVSGANQGRYGIAVQLDLNCTMTNEGLANAITNNQNENTQSIINNDNSNTQAIIDSNTETKESIDNVNDTLNDETAPSDSEIEDLFDIDVESSTPISDLITMPILLLHAYYSGFAGSCSSYNLGSLFGHDIILPCIDLENILGSTLYGLIDMCMSLFLAYNIGLMCISIFESITSLHDNFMDAYQPRHTYHPKHGGDE